MRSPADDTSIEWLKSSPPLTELCAAYPDEWETVHQQLVDLLRRGSSEELTDYLKRLSQQSLTSAKKSGAVPIRELVRHQMAYTAIRQHLVSLASGVESGKVKFNLLNGLVAQRLLFAHDLERKPVSMFWFRLIWPLIWQKRYLMPLVQPKGIYCFYSQELVKGLVEIIGDLRCLEIAAGDGTLSRFLKQSGVHLATTDDYSWQHSVSYPEWVVRKDAREALRQYSPEAVICSWPPAGNSFERAIFRTRSVKQYILITSRHRHAAGNWESYQEQQLFDMRENPALSRLVLPPELDAVIYVFTRKPAIIAQGP